MRTVDIGIRHDHNAVIAQLGDIKVLINTGAQRQDDRHQLFVAEHLIQPCLFHVEHLAPQG